MQVQTASAAATRKRTATANIQTASKISISLILSKNLGQARKPQLRAEKRDRGGNNPGRVVALPPANEQPRPNHRRREADAVQHDLFQVADFVLFAHFFTFPHRAPHGSDAFSDCLARLSPDCCSHAPSCHSNSRVRE